MNIPRTMLIIVVFLLVIPTASALSGNWTQVNASAEFPERYQHTSVIFGDSLWVIGGYDSAGGYNGGYWNDTWYSSDGNLWYQANASAEFPARNMHSSVVYNNRMWVIGGVSAGNLKHDVWYSSDGVTWNQATAAAAFTARNGHTSVVYDNKMWVMGGFDGGYKNDVWYSSDGVTWNQATAAAAFPARQSHTALNATNKMWVIGGYDGGTMNDVWYSSDGVTWNQVTAAAAFPALYCHTSVVYDDRMWVIGGLDGVGTILDKAWQSSDGITWAAATVPTPMPQREAHTSVVSGSRMWLLGGFDGANTNSTWSFLSSPVAAFTANRTSGNTPLTVAFTDTSTGYPASYAWIFGDSGTSTAANSVHTYTAAGTYTVSLTVTNSDGTSTETKAGYISVTDPETPTGGSDDEAPGPVTVTTHLPATVTVNVGGNSAVTRVAVTGTGLSDLIMTGTVQSGPGTGIPPAPGIVYQYIDLVPARYLTITGSEIFFSVPAAWLEEHQGGTDTVVMYHYTGSAWEPLPTTILATKDGRVYFSARGPEFSLFAITARTSERAVRPDSSTSLLTFGELTEMPESIPKVTGSVVTKTTPARAAPLAEPDSGSPLIVIAILATGCIGLVCGVLLVRRWWIRKQNPALFREFK